MFDNLGQWIAYVMETFGLVGLAVLLLAENLFPPIPSELVLPLAGFFVGRGTFGFAGALVASTLGSVAGALILYALGRHGGRPLILRYGRALRVKERDLDRVEGWFERYGDSVVLFARVVPLARSVISIPAGILDMPLGRFMVLTALGSAAWNALLIGAGWTLGSNWTRVSAVVGRYSDVVLVLAFVATVALLGRWAFVRRRRSPERGMVDGPAAGGFRRRGTGGSDAGVEERKGRHGTPDPRK